MPLQTIKRWLMLTLAALVLLLIVIAGTLQFYIFPHIDQYKPRIAQALSDALHQPVSIGQLGIHWQGITPEATLDDLILFDAQHRPALQLKQVDAGLSWTSVLLLSPTLSKLHIASPNLVVRRNAKGEVFLAGIALAGNDNPAFANWLIQQHNIQIAHATVTWIDEQRGAPPLSLRDLNLELDMPPWLRLLGRHRLHVDSLLSVGTRQRVALDATLVGHDVSKLQDWHGNAQWRLPQIDLAAWQAWLDLPFQLHQGRGSLVANVAFAGMAIQQLQSKLDLTNVVVSPPQHQQRFQAKFIRGELLWQREKQAMQLTLHHVSANIHPSLGFTDASGKLEWQGEDWQGELTAQQLTLENSAALADWLPANSPLIAPLTGIAPQGTARQLRLSAQYQQHQWKNYAVEAGLENISTQAYEQVPGLQHWRGHLSLQPNQGALAINTENASLDTAGLLRWPIPISQLNGNISWQNNGSKTLISTRGLKLENPHLGLTLDLEYQLGAAEGDSIQLQGQITHGNATFASFYYPNILGSATLHWLDTSILAGNLKRGEVIVRGRVKDFPFVNDAHQSDPKLGLFRVTAQIEHALLEYGTGWPTINDLNAQLKFEGKRMDIAVQGGKAMGYQISPAHAEVARLDADNPMLNMHAVAKGSVEQGVKFVNASPVKEVAMGFTDHLKASGAGELLLDLQIPLEDIEAAHFQGDYAIKGGHIAADANMGLPELSKINGHLKFTEKGLQAQNVQLELYDNPALLQLSSRADKAIVIQGSGRITDAALRKLTPNLLTAALHGSADWKANIFIQQPVFQLDIRSSLIGMASQLPVPFNKSADTSANLQISLNQNRDKQDMVEVNYDEWIHAKFLRQQQGQETQITAGEIAINTPVRLPSGDGIHLHADFVKLNVDDWLDYFKKNNTAESVSASASMGIRSMDISANLLQIFERHLHQIKLQIQPATDRLNINIEGQELAGDADWLQGKQNKLVAKLNYLRIPRGKSADDSKPAVEIRRQTSPYPELEIAAQDFQFGDKNLGSLDLKAYNSGDNWVIQRMALTNPDSQLLADGVWRNTVRNPNTQLKFSLNSSNLGKTLQRFQPGELVKGGNGSMSGQIGWPGSPHEFATERLDGHFKLQLEKGQILKVQPGVGRLLGLLSLQSLPRRLTLDFRDLFSDGFAFDRISCTANINDGILRSQDLFMTGPAAEANIRGETNLKTETQLLKVKVAPHISDSLSLAALAGGPVAGVAAFVAQKLLKDPLNKISSSEYMIGGTWDNPQEIDGDKPTSVPNTNKK